MSLAPVFFANRSKFLTSTLLNSRGPWRYAVMCCLYFLVAYRCFLGVIPMFAKLFEGLGVEVPLPTRFLIATFWWLLPAIFLGAAALIIARQFVRLDGLRLRFTNFVLIFVGGVLVPLIVLDLYLPFLDLIWKFHSLK